MNRTLDFVRLAQKSGQDRAVEKLMGHYDRLRIILQKRQQESLLSVSVKSYESVLVGRVELAPLKRVPEHQEADVQ